MEKPQASLKASLWKILMRLWTQTIHVLISLMESIILQSVLDKYDAINSGTASQYDLSSGLIDRRGI